MYLILSAHAGRSNCTRSAVGILTTMPTIHRTQERSRRHLYDTRVWPTLSGDVRAVLVEHEEHVHVRVACSTPGSRRREPRALYETLKKQCARARPPLFELFEPTNVVSTKRRCKSKGVFISEPCCHHWVTLGKQVTLPWSAPSYRRRGPLAHRERG